MSVISFPTPPHQNEVIRSDFYAPTIFDITAIALGVTTTITTSAAHDYVIGQEVRLIIPPQFGTRKLNGRAAFVISIPSTTQVEVNIDSQLFDAFVPTPFTSTITGATQALNCVLTSTNFYRSETFLTISGVGGMTELNGSNHQIISRTATIITLDTDSTAFTAYTTGGATVIQGPQTSVAQIFSIGDINNGVLSSTGREDISSAIPGSFINISPQ